jgi:hypothetical protein
VEVAAFGNAVDNDWRDMHSLAFHFRPYFSGFTLPLGGFKEEICLRRAFERYLTGSLKKHLE